MAVGTMIAIDRRTTGAQVEDQGIELHASSHVRERLGDRGHVNITSFNRQVLLTGEVPSEADKQMVEQLIAKVDNVRTTVNEIAVMSTTSLSQRSSDTLITGQVKAGLVDAKDIFASAFKVVTERGTVYLMGRVTQKEASRATDVARSINGVNKVVRVLEIISEEELKRLQTP
jgi:osmotically-inducible protein OsmY